MVDKTQFQEIIKEKDSHYSTLISEYEKLRTEIVQNQKKYEALEQKEILIDEETGRINTEIEELEKQFEESLQTQKNLDEQEYAENLEEELRHLGSRIEMKQGQAEEQQEEINRIEEQIQEKEDENELIIEESKQFQSLEEWTIMRDQLQKQLCEQSESQNTAVQEIVMLIQKIKKLENNRQSLQLHEKEFHAQIQNEAQSRDLLIRTKEVQKLLDDLDQAIQCELNEYISKALKLIELCKLVCIDGGEEILKRSGLIKLENRVFRLKEYLQGLLSKVKSIVDALPQVKDNEYEQHIKVLNDINKQIACLNRQLEDINCPDQIEQCIKEFENTLQSIYVQRAKELKQEPSILLSELVKNKEPHQLLKMINEILNKHIKDQIQQSYLESIHSSSSDSKLKSIQMVIVILQLEYILNAPSLQKAQLHYQENIVSLKDSCLQAQEGLRKQLMAADQQLRQCETKVKAFGQQQMFTASNDFELKIDLQQLYKTLNEKLNYPLECRLNSEVDALSGQFNMYFTPNILEISGSQNLGIIAELANELLENTYKVSKKLQDYSEYIKSFDRQLHEKTQYHSYKVGIAEELKIKKEKYQRWHQKCLIVLSQIQNGKEVSGIEQYSDQLQNVENLIQNTEHLLQKSQELIVTLDELKQQLQSFSSLPDIPTLFEHLQAQHEKQQSQIKNQEQAQKRLNQEQQLAFAKKRHEAEKASKQFKDLLKQATDKFNQLQSEMYHHSNSQEALKQLDALRRELQSLMQLDHDNDDQIKHAQEPSSLEHNLILDTILQQTKDGISKLSEIQKDIELKRKENDESISQKQQKEALYNDIAELQSQQLPDLINQIKRKLEEIAKNCESSEKLAEAMKDNPDFQEKKQQLEQILLDLHQASQENMKLQDTLQSLEMTQPQIQKKAISKVDVQQLQALKDECQKYIQEASEIDSQADHQLRKANKLREKLRKNCVIKDIINQKRKALNTLSDLINDCDKCIQNSQTIQSPEVQKQMKGISKLLKVIQNEKNAVEKKLTQLEKSDMSSLDDDQIVKLINDLKDIGQKLDTQTTDINNIKSQLQNIKTKHTEEDYHRRVSDLSQAIDQSKQQIKQLKKKCESLQELCDDFTGYCSDEQETQLINLLGQKGELREILILLRTLASQNEQLQDSLLTLKDSNTEKKDCQQRDSMLSNLEDSVKNHQQNISEVDARIERHMQSANAFNGNQKVSKRQREVEELDRKIGQMDIIVQRIIEESQLDIDKAQSDGLTDDKQKLIGEMQQLQKELKDLQNDLEERLMKHIQEVQEQANFLLTQVNSLSNMDMLKRSKRLKKQILAVLKQAQLARNAFNDLRTRYESCKLRLRTIPKYKPLQGDDLDRMLAEWIQVNSCPIPIERLGGGYYSFGQKKIFAKITNGKLVIRVGGGYMGIDEFMYYYGAQELNKMLAYEGLDDIVEEINLDQIIRQEKQSNKNIIQKFDDGKVVIGGQKFKQRFSPNRRTGSNNGRMSANDGRSSPGAAAYYQSNISPGRMSPGSSASRANANMFLKIQKQSSANSGTVKSVQIVRDGGGSPKDSHNSHKISTNCLITAATMDTLPSVGKTEQAQSNHLAIEPVATSAFQVTIAKRSPQRKASGSGIMLQNYASAGSQIVTNPKKDQLSMTTQAIYNQYLKHQVNGIIGSASSLQTKISPKIDKSDNKQQDANDVSFSRANSSFGEVNNKNAQKDQGAPPQFKILELMKEKKAANQSKSALNK